VYWPCLAILNWVNYSFKPTYLEVSVEFASRTLLLIKSQLKTLQHISLVIGYFLRFEVVRIAALLDLMAQVFEQEVLVFDRLLQLMHPVLLLLADLVALTLQENQLLCKVQIILFTRT